jgi:probable rRNA maturation factor
VITIHVANRQTALDVDQSRLREAVRMILDEASIREAEMSVAVVDDPTIHALNRRYLSHDGPTDVLSFVLERSGQKLEGEVVVSAETATRAAARFGWSADDELLLYVIHGTLHLVGHDDQTPPQRAAMRARERACLARFGLEPRYDEQEPAEHHPTTDRSPRPTSGGSQLP